MEQNLTNDSCANKAPLPAEIAKKFNWGAFLLNWIWGLGNKTFITLVIFPAALLGLIPFVGAIAQLALVIWFGMKGNEWAWNNKEWESVEQFNDVQKKWAIAGIILFVLGVIFSIVCAALIGVAALKSTP